MRQKSGTPSTSSERIVKDMPRGPKRELRPADVIGSAVKVMKIAVGEETVDVPADDGKNRAVQVVGSPGVPKT